MYLAIRLAEGGTPHGVIAGWLAWDLGWRVAVGVVVGVGVGRLVGVVAFRPPGPLTALAETPQGFLAVATTLIAYGATEILHGYGFLAVFIAAVALRSSERSHEFHADLHGFVEQTENLLVVGLLLLLGASLASGVLSAVWWQPLAIAMAVVLLLQAGQRTAGPARQLPDQGGTLGRVVLRHPGHRLAVLLVVRPRPGRR